MMDFIYELYKNDNFTLYLTIILVILVILFFIVLIFGKKDQKLEETKRLQKIDLDSFKEDPREPIKVETVLTKEEVGTPKIDEPQEVKSFFDDTQALPNVSDFVEVKDDDVETTVFEPVNPIIEEDDDVKVFEIPKQEETPLFSNDESETTISFEDFPKMDSVDINLENDLNELENIRNEFESIELPKVEEPEINDDIKPVYKPSQVFSSVFVDKKDELEKIEQPIDKAIANDDENNSNVEVKNFNVFSTDEDDDSMELPSLKDSGEKKDNVELPKEEKVFSFDDLNGETYNIK